MTCKIKKQSERLLLFHTISLSRDAFNAINLSLPCVKFNVHIQEINENY